MRTEKLKDLKRGNIVRHVSTGDSYVIEMSLGPGLFIGVDTIYITNPREWVKIDPDTSKEIVLE